MKTIRLLMVTVAVSVLSTACGGAAVPPQGPPSAPNQPAPTATVQSAQATRPPATEQAQSSTATAQPGVPTKPVTAASTALTSTLPASPAAATPTKAAASTSVGMTASAGTTVPVSATAAIAGASSTAPAKLPASSATVATISQGSAAIFGINLIVNGDAETGPSADRDNATVSPTGWESTGAFTSVKWGADGVLRKDDPGPPNKGSAFFAGGSKSETSSGFQRIDVSAGAADIDAGKVKFSLDAYLGGYSNQPDSATLTATFRASNGAPLGTGVVGPSKPEDRGKENGLTPFSTAGTVPVGTRTIDVLLLMTRLDGSYNDGYADNISLVLARN